MKVSILLGKYRQKHRYGLLFHSPHKKHFCHKTQRVVFLKRAQINYRQQANTMRKSYNTTDDHAKFSCNL